MIERVTLDREEWRSIPGWPDYEVSTRGQVKRLACLGLDGRRLKERILKQSSSKLCGASVNYRYISVTLGNSVNAKSYSVARLVLLAFVGPPEEGQECRHLNDISTNCHLSNLAWGTRQQNRQDAIDNGRMASGEANGSARLSEAQVIEIRSRYKPHSRARGAAALGREFDVAVSTIASIVHHQSWKHV